MTRDVGRLGESTLQTWADQEGLILNRAAHDASGWDFVLEWPSHMGGKGEDLKLPLDKTGAPFQCLIQVKSSDSETPRPKVKLDIWRRFVGSPLPAFFLVLSFAGRNECSDAYLVPVWEDEMRNILRRLRELSADGAPQDVELHKKHAALKYANVHRLPQPNGKSLAAAVEKHVGEGIEPYSRRKLELLQKLGYEDGTAALDMHFTIPRGVHPHEYLVDFALGVVPELEVIGGSAFDTRFGIRSRPPTLTFEPGTTLRMRGEEPLPAQVTASLASGGTITLQLDAILPRAVGHVVDKRYMKIILRRAFIELTVQPYRTQKVNYRCHIPELDVRYELSECRPVAELIRLWVGAADGGIAMELAIKIEGKPIGVSKLDPPPPLGDGFKKWGELVRYAWIVARHFEVEDDAPITLNELLASADALHLMAYILEPSGGVFRIEYSLEKLENANPQHCIPLVAEAQFGGWTFQVGAALVGNPDITEEGSSDRRYSFQGRDIRLHVAVKYAKDVPVERSVEDIREELIERYDDKMTVVLVG